MTDTSNPAPLEMAGTPGRKFSVGRSVYFVDDAGTVRELVSGNAEVHADHVKALVREGCTVVNGRT